MSRLLLCTDLDRTLIPNGVQAAAPGALALDCFALAADIRLLDMQASPYDLSSYGHPPVKIETPEGKAETLKVTKGDVTPRGQARYPDPTSEKVANAMMDKIRAIKGITDLEYSQQGANPATIVKINNELASDLGVSIQQVGAALRPFVAGDQISRWLAPDGQNYDVNVQLPKSGRQRVADLAQNLLAEQGRAATLGRAL